MNETGNEQKINSEIIISAFYLGSFYARTQDLYGKAHISPDVLDTISIAFRINRDNVYKAFDIVKLFIHLD